MIPVLFYGVEYGSSFGSIVALEKLGQPYRLCRIEMPGESQGTAYKAINPVGELPALITDAGRLLTESVAILHHIAERGIVLTGGGALLPKSGTWMITVRNLFGALLMAVAIWLERV